MARHRPHQLQRRLEHLDALHLHAFAREFVKRHAALLDGGNHRRCLHDVAEKSFRGGIELLDRVDGKRGARVRMWFPVDGVKSNENETSRPNVTKEGERV